MTSSYVKDTSQSNVTTGQIKKNVNDYSISSSSSSSSSDDEILDQLRNAALRTLRSNKRKNKNDDSPVSRRSYSSSNYESSSRSHSPSLSTISSDSLDKHDKDYRFETNLTSSIGDIDERFPQDISNDHDLLIVNCPNQDDEFNLTTTKSLRDQDERYHYEPSKINRKKRENSANIEHPVSKTGQLNSDRFDLRQLIKKRHSDKSNHRTVEISSDTNNLIVNRLMDDNYSSTKKFRKH